MNNIKFRQAIFLGDEFHHWHYWGFIDGAFIGPETNLSSTSEALKNSQMFTTLLDKNKARIYEGDKVKDWHNDYKAVVVEWDEGWSGFAPFINFTNHHQSDMTEVIGNTYESD